MIQMKINGTPIRHIKNDFAEFDIYQVELKDGPMKNMLSCVGNSRILWANGHRYELNGEGDFVYAPEGLN